MRGRSAESLDGRVVAITGGARGIGLRTATALHRQGCRVAIGDLDLELAAEAAAGIGPDVLALPLDVTDRESFRDFLDRVEQQLGPLDVLVNNAGIMPLGRFDEEGDATGDRILAVNVGGVVTGTRLAVQRMLPRNRGHIVNLASQVGRAPFAGAVTYSASKHAVVGLSLSLADELEPTGVRVSCVLPAVVQTGLAAGVGAPRLLPPTSPDSIAKAIVRILRRPRRTVYVPALGRVVGPIGLLPVPARHLIERLLGARNLLLRSDRKAREGYERRVGGRG